MVYPGFGDAPARRTVPSPISTETDPPTRSYDLISVEGTLVVVVVWAEVVVVAGAASTGSGSGSEAGGAVVVWTVVGVSDDVVVVVAGVEVVEAVESSMGAGAIEVGSTGSTTKCSVLLIAIVVGGSIAVGVSVTWSRTLLTAAEAMSTAVTVTTSQMSG